MAYRHLLLLLLPTVLQTRPVQAQTLPPVSIPNTQSFGFYSTLANQDYVLHVNLPAGYGSGESRYPVLYLLDGQWDFPLLSAIYGEQYFDGFIPAVITVGITWGGKDPNYDRLRARDFTPTSPGGSPNWGNAPRFLSFIRRELIPHIDSVYRTDQTQRTLIGSSLGGLFTLYALFSGPDLFDHYVLTSPAFQWDNNSLDNMEKVFADKGAAAPVRLFMAVGALEPGAPAFQRYADHLEHAKYHNVEIETRVLENTGHSGTKAEGYTRGLQSVFARPSLKLPSSTLALFTGNYQAGNETYFISREKDHLAIRRNNGPTMPLNAASENDFYVKGTHINLHFKRNEKGLVQGFDFHGYNQQQYIPRQTTGSGAGNAAPAFRIRRLTDPTASSPNPMASSLHPSAPADTLTGRVYHWTDLFAQKDSSRDRREIVDGKTPDLASLEIHASTLDPGKAPHPAHKHADMEELVIVKEGRLRSTIAGKTNLLGPGSIALALPGDMHGFENAASTRTTYYVLKFQTRSAMDIPRGKKGGGSITVNWDTLAVQSTGKGERRDLFNKATALFSRLDLHATTLNAGEVSHAPHVHRQEEIILIRSGNVTMQIGSAFYPATAGDLVFLPSGVPHALRNTGAGPCQYFALQWSE